MASSADTWAASLKEKVEALRELLLTYLMTKQDATADSIKKHLAATTIMYSPKNIPALLNELGSLMSEFRANKEQPHTFLRLMSLYERLPTVVSFDEVEPPSFDSIFQSYKNDKDLNGLVDELVKTLEKVLAEADDSLSAQIVRELEAILKQIKKNRRTSLYELLPWVDWGMRGLLLIAEMHTGFKGMELVYDAIKLSRKVKYRLIEGYGESKNRLLKDHKLIFIQKAAARISEEIANERGDKLLNPPEEKTT